MSDAYLIDEDSTTAHLHRIRCRNEDTELQSLLPQDSHLRPSKQIDPESLARWLLVKREVPVPDPGSGSDRRSASRPAAGFALPTTCLPLQAEGRGPA